jgi:hypothetical protein
MGKPEEQAETGQPIEAKGRRWRFGMRFRVLRAVIVTCREMKAEGVVYGEKDDALAAVLERLQTPQGEAAKLLKDIDWDLLLELIQQMLPLIMALIQMFLL